MDKIDRTPKGLRLISFDGGGLRGLAGLLVVLEMMQRLMFDLELPNTPRPCEYFEMATGSGTGGLNAILIGRLGFTAERAIYHYIRIAKVAFSENQIDPKQRISNVRSVLEDVVKDAGLQVETMMEGTDTQAGNCRTFVCVATIGDVTQVRLLRSYRGRAFHSPSCTIIDAALATLSSWGFLEPITIEGIGASEDFIDGDISCSNPTLELLKEAADFFDPHIKIMCILSLGSGRESVVASSEGTAARDMVTIHTHFSIACERIHEDLQRRTRNLNIYFRLNPGRDINSSQIQEWKQISFLKTQVTSYLQMEMISQQLDTAVSALQSNPNGILLSAINNSTRLDVRDVVPAHIRSQFEDNFDSHILAQQKIAPAQGAIHEKCLQGTRFPILERIRRWADQTLHEKPIFWLCDSAGTGKSTIAMTIGEEWGNTDRLAGLFCFSSSSASISSASLFFPTIAVDMASRIPELRSTIADVFKKDPIIVNRGLAEQFTRLILEPLKKISREVILIIDAADECEPVSRSSLLKLLVQPVPHLKLLITSRAEHEIIAILESSAVVHTVEFQLQTTEIVSNVDDISTYINYHLSHILSEEQCQLLVERANGLFIWASTAKRELDTNSAFESTEDTIARLMSSGDSEGLGLLYYQILERVARHPKHIEFMCQVLGLLATVQEPLSIKSLELFIPTKPVENLMRRLRSVFNFKSRDDPILFFHPTFREYLLASERGTFIIGVTNSHHLIASQCFNFMRKELKQDICGTGHSIGHFPDIKDNPDWLARLKSCVSTPLLYSVKYWCVHMEYCLEIEEMLEKLLAFFRRNLLHWVEVLSLSNQIVAGINGLYELRKRVHFRALEPSPNQLNQVENWCNDTLRLIQTQQKPLEVNPFAIYAIIVTSAPRQGILYNEYWQGSKESVPKIPKGWRNRWPSHIVLSGHTSYVDTIAISSDGTRMASGSGDGTLRIWDAITGASIGDPIQHVGIVKSVSFFPNGLRIATGTDKGEVATWDLATEKAIGLKLQGHTNSVNQLANFPDGIGLISASSDNTLKLWDTRDFNATPITIDGHTEPVLSVSISSDGSLIASGSRDKTIRLWNGNNGISVGDPLRGHNRWVVGVAFSPSDELIASASHEHTLRLWRVEGHECIGMLYGHSSPVWCLSYSHDGTTLASGSEDETIQLWSVATLKSISQLKPHSGTIRCISFVPQGNRVVFGTRNHKLQIWDLNTQQGEEEVQNGHEGEVYDIAFSPCGSKVATCSKDRTLKLWSTVDGELIGEMKGHTQGVYCLAFSPDGFTIASGSADSRIRLWDVTTMECFKVLQNYVVNCIVFSHDGRRILSDAYHDLRLRDSATGLKIGSNFVGHEESIYCIAFSPDDTMIVSGSYDDSVRLWSIAGEELHAYLHQNEPTFTRFSTDNLHILSACDEEVIICNISSLDNVAQFPHFHSSPMDLSPILSHIQNLKFDLTTTSASYWQSSAVEDSVRRYFRDPRRMQVCFDKDTRTITLSNSSDYLFHVPADLTVHRWKAKDGVIVFGGEDGKLVILDFSHLPM